MRKFAIALATTAIASTAALASNTAAFSGFHVGAQVGIGLAHGSYKDHAHDGLLDTVGFTGIEYSGTFSGDRSAVGFEGGIHGGYDWVNNGKWLFGLAVAGDLSAMKSKVENRSGPFVGVGGGGARTDIAIRSRYSQEWTVSAGVRAGQLIGDSFLLYAGLNWAGAEWELNQTLAITDPQGTGAAIGSSSFKNSKFLNGFRPAVGFAKALTDHIVLTGEYSHTWYETFNNRRSFAQAALSADPAHKMTAKYKPEVGTFRLKMSWRLNGMGMGTAS